MAGRALSMADAARLLGVLRLGDSAFPSGGFAFSWGLETLKDDGRVRDGAGVEAFAAGLVRWRWATSDRVFVRRAAAGGEDAWIALDAEIEAMTLAAELRDGSCRAGRALLRAHAGLGTPSSGAWRRLLEEGRVHGHLPVVQGALWSGAGLAAADVEALSAWTLASGICQAAVRLALMGPLEAQRVIARLADDIAAILSRPPPEIPHAFTPLADIAVMRHERGAARLFAN